MDYPPAPVLDDREIRMLAPQSRGHVEARDRDRGDEEEREQRLLFVISADARRRCSLPMRYDPEDEADRQGRSARPGRDRRTRTRWWPNQNHSEPPSLCFTLSHSPASEPRTTTSSAPKSTFTPSRWPLRSALAHGGRDVQAGGQPGGRDPEDPDLCVPRSRRRCTGGPARAGIP